MILYDGIKRGLRPLGKKAAETVQETDSQKAMHEIANNAKVASDNAHKLLHDVLHQAQINNQQLTSHLERLMENHLETAKALLDAAKKMHGF